jgi:hypothetical protein
MQKLGRRNTYTPTNIPHVCSNCDLPLNGEETPCVAGLKTFSNNSDAALTGLGDSSRAKPAGTCCKNHLNLLNIERDPVIVKTGYQSLKRGMLLHTLKSVVSAIPAPHDVL